MSKNWWSGASEIRFDQVEIDRSVPDLSQNNLLSIVELKNRWKCEVPEGLLQDLDDVNSVRRLPREIAGSIRLKFSSNPGNTVHDTTDPTESPCANVTGMSGIRAAFLFLADSIAGAGPHWTHRRFVPDIKSTIKLVVDFQDFSLKQFV